MRLLNQTWLGVLAALPLAISSLAADNPETNHDAEIEALKKQLQELVQKVDALEKERTMKTEPMTNAATTQTEELDQRIRILERQRELDQEAAATAAKTAPKISVGANGLAVSSADTNFVFSLKGIVQMDSRTFFDDTALKSNDGFLLRRARPIFQGTLYRDFEFRIMPDFGGSSVQLYDAYGNYRFAPWIQLRAGKFKTPEGLEQLQEDIYTSFNERSLVTDLVPNRDVGIQLWGVIHDGWLTYAAGVFNGVGDARNSNNSASENNVEFAGRLFLEPFKDSDIVALQNLGVGVAGTTEHDSGVVNALPSTTGGTLPGYATDGQQQFFAYNPASGVVYADGEHWRLSPQGYYYNGPFGLLGEYAISDQGVSNGGNKAHLKNTAWEISAGWVLTGEDATFKGVAPAHPFAPHSGGWGAWQLVARYAELDIDHDAFPLFSNPATSASAAQAWAVGLNWYLNKNVRLNTSYSRTTFTGGGGVGSIAPAVVTRQPEDVLFTRIQLAF